MPLNCRNPGRKTTPLVLVVQYMAIIAVFATTAALSASRPAHAANGVLATTGSTGSAANTAPSAITSGTVEQDVGRLMAEIREAEARVAGLQHRLEMLANDARLSRSTARQSGTLTGGVNGALEGVPEHASAQPRATKAASEANRQDEGSLLIDWIIGASALAAACMLVAARLGARNRRGTQIDPLRPLAPIRRILRNCADLHRERKRRARQEKRLQEHLRKIAASSKAPAPGTRRTPQLRVVR